MNESKQDRGKKILEALRSWQNRLVISVSHYTATRTEEKIELRIAFEGLEDIVLNATHNQNGINVRLIKTQLTGTTHIPISQIKDKFLPPHNNFAGFVPRPWETSTQLLFRFFKDLLQATLVKFPIIVANQAPQQPAYVVEEEVYQESDVDYQEPGSMAAKAGSETDEESESETSSESSEETRSETSSESSEETRSETSSESSEEQETMVQSEGRAKKVVYKPIPEKYNILTAREKAFGYRNWYYALADRDDEGNKVPAVIPEGALVANKFIQQENGIPKEDAYELLPMTADAKRKIDELIAAGELNKTFDEWIDLEIEASYISEVVLSKMKYGYFKVSVAGKSTFMSKQEFYARIVNDMIQPSAAEKMIPADEKKVKEMRDNKTTAEYVKLFRESGELHEAKEILLENGVTQDEIDSMTPGAIVEAAHVYMIKKKYGQPYKGVYRIMIDGVSRNAYVNEVAALDMISADFKVIPMNPILRTKIEEDLSKMDARSKSIKYYETLHSEIRSKKWLTDKEEEKAFLDFFIVRNDRGESVFIRKNEAIARRIANIDFKILTISPNHYGNVREIIRKDTLPYMSIDQIVERIRKEDGESLPLAEIRGSMDYTEEASSEGTESFEAKRRRLGYDNIPIGEIEKEFGDIYDINKMRGFTSDKHIRDLDTNLHSRYSTPGYIELIKILLGKKFSKDAIRKMTYKQMYDKVIEYKNGL